MSSVCPSLFSLYICWEMSPWKLDMFSVAAEQLNVWERAEGEKWSLRIPLWTGDWIALCLLECSWVSVGFVLFAVFFGLWFGLSLLQAIATPNQGKNVSCTHNKLCKSMLTHLSSLCIYFAWFAKFARRWKVQFKAGKNEIGNELYLEWTELSNALSWYNDSYFVLPPDTPSPQMVGKLHGQLFYKAPSREKSARKWCQVFHTFPSWA